MHPMMDEDEQKRILDTWLHTHRGLVFKVLRAFATSQHDQDDLFQEISFQIWMSIPKFREESSPATWVYRVALYAAMKWSKQENRRKDKHEDLDVSVAPAPTMPAGENPQVAWLYQQIATFPPVDRSLMLFVLEGFSYREIAEALGLSESHVGVKINRIKKVLAQRTIT
jgi:RNA polymerase sigma-70 factor (ECF subfamily)